ncbi:MAG TPA: autotransporter assembly complex family protein [Gammaproteobacteria bacterium]|nr:autotransporter assembly complex family protein [Gammaproteobacteria bacterium]
MPNRLSRTGRLVVGSFASLLASSAFAELTLTGLDDQLRENVLAYLDLDEEPCDAPQWRIQREYQAAPDDVASALEALGFYAVETTGTLDLAADCWRAELIVQPGEPVRIRTLDLVVDGDAAGDSAFTRALEESSLRVGETLNHGNYERLKRRWSDLGLERGYPESRLAANRIDVYPEELAADIVLHLESGTRYRFGQVEIHQDILTDRLIRAYLPFQPADPYDNRQLTELYVALSDSGYFQTIDVRPLQADSERKEIPVSITLTPAPRRLITYGVGFSTDTGPRLQLGRNNRRWNERGHQFGVNAQLSTVISEVTANYRFPFGNPRTEWINFDAGTKREDTESAQSKSLQFGARRVVDTPRRWTRTQMLSLLIEEFEVADQVGRSRLLMPGIDWSRIRADNAIRPRQGSKLDLELRGAGDGLGSDTSFAQVIAEGKWIWSLPNAARVLVRSQVGTTWASSFDELPASVRFFAGGDNSVRGYKFKELGPVDATGKVIGGSSLITASFEYEQPLRERWSLAFFVDSGNAFEGSTFDVRTGVGIGARWQSPLGPIRIDLAQPVHDAATNDVRLHISLGPDL